MSKMFEFVKKGYLHDMIWKYDTKPVITENGTDIDVSGLDKIDVNVPNPSTGKVNITSTAEVNVTNYAAAQVVDANLVAGNIKKDVSILGVTGSYEAPASDFSTAEVTIDPTNANTLTLPLPAIFSSGGISALLVEIVHGGDDGGTYTVPLYKGMCVLAVETDEAVNVSGDCEYEDGQFTITGDCSITIQTQQ